MRTSIPMVAAGILAVGSAALAAEGTSPSGGEARPGTRLQGSPNAAGYTGQGGMTGSPNTGAPGSEMPETDGFEIANHPVHVCLFLFFGNDDEYLPCPDRIFPDFNHLLQKR